MTDSGFPTPTGCLIEFLYPTGCRFRFALPDPVVTSQGIECYALRGAAARGSTVRSDETLR